MTAREAERATTEPAAEAMGREASMEVTADMDEMAGGLSLVMVEWTQFAGGLSDYLKCLGIR